MNYREEKYPKSIIDLLNIAEYIAHQISISLNNENCKTIGDIFVRKHETGFTRRNSRMLQELGYHANVSNKTSKPSDKNNEFKGLYVFGEVTGNEVKPIYVGISRTVFRRLRQHINGKLHNECTLAYLMAKHNDNELTRNNCVDSILIPQKEVVRSYKVVLYPVLNDYELYFFEVALAGIFKTKWNSFRTH